MIRHSALIGMSLLSALLLCSLTAQSASAAKSVNTTAVTCVQEGGFGFEDFFDHHCDVKTTPGNGTFNHEFIAGSTTTEVSAFNALGSAALKSKIGFTAVEIICGIVKNKPEQSLLHNVETEGKHTLTGTVRTLFTNCTVTKPAKCTVKEPFEANATFSGVEKLGAFENEMGVELVGSGAEETLAEFTFQGAECALKGQTFKLKGAVIGTSGTGKQAERFSGATTVFTPEGGMEKLKLGTATAELTLTVEQSNASSLTPIAGTTST